MPGGEGQALRDKRPGDFSHQLVGPQASEATHGWRRFMLTDPAVYSEDPNSYVASIDESSGNTEVTGSSITTYSPYLNDYACWQMPLTDATGREVNWSQPFQLKTMVEYISMTGDFDNLSNYHQPAYGFGIGQNATDIDGTNAANKFLGAGQFAYNKDNAGDPQFKRLFGKSYQTTGRQSSKSSAITSGFPALCVSDWTVYPSVGDINDGAITQNSCSVTTRFYGTESAGYKKNTNISVHKYTISQWQAQPNVTGPVHLFAFFGDYVATNGSQAQAVVTVRLWYMVHSGPWVVPPRVNAWKGTGVT